jgi:hypothetical protein
VSNIQLVINKMTNPAKAASLAAWLLRHAPCLGSLTLDASASFPPAQHHLHLQQVLPAVQQAAIAATNPAEGGGGGGPLGLMRLVLKGLIVSYPQLGTLLGSLRWGVGMHPNQHLPVKALSKRSSTIANRVWCTSYLRWGSMRHQHNRFVREPATSSGGRPPAG